ncbi:MAG: aldo/keto reductase [Hyphomicrobiales bacterium]|nr:aldo/keto reductase [Hyphomicrobiales bacterium]
MILQEIYTLPNGVKIPKLGLGTWRIDDGLAAKVVRAAAQIGYRHFDTAQAYGNDRGVGEGLRSSGVPREQLFVTTKVDAGLKTYAEAKASVDTSLRALGLDAIDLIIIHSPQPWADFHSGQHFFEGNLEVWRALEEAYASGKARAIGVSNFERVDLDNILTNASIKPAVNQVLAHVGSTPFDLITYCEQHGILVGAYSPIAHGAILNDREIHAIAERLSVTVPQLCIRYCLQLGLAPLPKTANREHMQSNAALDFEIAASDMDILKRVSFGDYGEASAFPVFGGGKR